MPIFYIALISRAHHNGTNFSCDHDAPRRSALVSPPSGAFVFPLHALSNLPAHVLFRFNRLGLGGHVHRHVGLGGGTRTAVGEWLRERGTWGWWEKTRPLIPAAAASREGHSAAAASRGVYRSALASSLPNTGMQNCFVRLEVSNLTAQLYTCSFLLVCPKRAAVGARIGFL